MRLAVRDRLPQFQGCAEVFQTLRPLALESQQEAQPFVALGHHLAGMAVGRVARQNLLRNGERLAIALHGLRRLAKVGAGYVAFHVPDLVVAFGQLQL